MNIRQPANLGVIRYLERLRARASRQEPDVRPPGDKRFDYWNLGSHPDIVERLWDQLAAPLRPEARQVVLGAPALVDPRSGMLLAIALGTSYAVRMSRDAKAVNTNTVIVWSDRTTLDLREEFGSDWVVGEWAERESEWCIRNTK